MKTVRDFLTKLRQSREDDSNLLDRTSVFLSRINAVGIVARASEARFCQEGGAFRTGVYLLILNGPK